MPSDELTLPELTPDPTPPATPAAPPAPAAPAAGEAGPDSDARARFSAGLAPVYDVPVSVQAVIGRTRIEVSDLLQLKEGSVLELDRRVGDAIDVYVNSRLVARGEIVIVDDQLGVTMTEIIKGQEQ